MAARPSVPDAIRTGGLAGQRDRRAAVQVAVGEWLGEGVRGGCGEQRGRHPVRSEQALLHRSGERAVIDRLDDESQQHVVGVAVSEGGTRWGVGWAKAMVRSCSDLQTLVGLLSMLDAI
jgi:hypothetical protein